MVINHIRATTWRLTAGLGNRVGLGGPPPLQSSASTSRRSMVVTIPTNCPESTTSARCTF